MKKLLIGTLVVPVGLLAWGYGTAKVGNIKYPECGEYWKTLSLKERLVMSVLAIPPVTRYFNHVANDMELTKEQILKRKFDKMYDEVTNG